MNLMNLNNQNGKNLKNLKNLKNWKMAGGQRPKTILDWRPKDHRGREIAANTKPGGWIRFRENCGSTVGCWPTQTADDA